MLGRPIDVKFALWWTIAWAVAIMALSPIVNYLTPFLNPAYNEALTPSFLYRLIVYWHGGLFEPWIVVLSALVYIVVGLDKLTGFIGKGLRLLLYAGAFIGVPLSGIAGIFNVSDTFALGIPHWAESAGFAFMDLLAIGLIVGLFVYPRASGKGYGKAGAPFYVVLLGVLGALAAAIMAYVGAFITAFSPLPPFFSSYVNATMYPSLGFYNDTAVSTFAQNALGSHSHTMLPILMGGVVALIAMVYGYQTWTKSQKLLGGIGFAIMAFGIVASVVVYWVAGVGNYAIPTLFVSGPGGVNGVAADDVITGLVGLGALFVLVGLLMHAFKERTQEGRVFMRDPLFLSVIAGWLMIYLIIPITGYFIEFNHDFYLAAGAAFTDAYGRFHQDFTFFLLPALITTILVFEAYGMQGSTRRMSGYLFLSGEIITFIFGGAYAMITLDPNYLYVAAFGGILMGLAVILGVNFLRKSQATTLSRNLG